MNKRRNFLKKIGLGIAATVLPLSVFSNDDTGYVIIELTPTEIIKIRKMDCYRGVTKVKSTQGRDVMISIWNSYAPWGKNYSLAFRSLDGKFSQTTIIDSLRDNTHIIYRKKLSKVEVPMVKIKLTERTIEPKTIKLKNKTIVRDFSHF